METTEKNIAQRYMEETKIEEGFFILKFQNDSSETAKFIREIDNSFIQFHFNVKGESKFFFNKGNYGLPLNEEKSLLLVQSADEPAFGPGVGFALLADLPHDLDQEIPCPVLPGSRLYLIFE